MNKYKLKDVIGSEKIINTSLIFDKDKEFHNDLDFLSKYKNGSIIIIDFLQTNIQFFIEPDYKNSMYQALLLDISDCIENLNVHIGNQFSCFWCDSKLLNGNNKSIIEYYEDELFDFFDRNTTYSLIDFTAPDDESFIFDDPDIIVTTRTKYL